MVNYGSQKDKEFNDLFVSFSDKLAEDDHCPSVSMDATKSEEKQYKRDFLCQTGYSSCLMDGSYAKCGSTLTKNHCSMWNDNYCLSGRDDFLDGEFAAGEVFNDTFDAPSSSKGYKFLELDDDVLSESSQGSLHHGCRELCNDVVIDKDFQKPFLKSCSIRGSILHEKALFANDEHTFQIDGYSTKQDLGVCRGRVENLGAHPCPEVVEIFNTSRDSVFYSGVSVEEKCFPSDSYSLATQLGCTVSAEEKCFPSDSCYPELLTSECYPIFKTLSPEATAWDVDHMTGTDPGVVGRMPSCYKWGDDEKILDDKENLCNIGCDISYSFKSDKCMRNFGNNTLYFDGPNDYNNLNFTKWPDPKLVNWPDYYDINSNKWSDTLTDGPGWLSTVSCGGNYQRAGKNGIKEDHVRYPAFKKNHERSRRSFSAPPFHKSRRFNSLNQPLSLIAKRPEGQTSKCSLNGKGFCFFFPLFPLIFHLATFSQ